MPGYNHTEKTNWIQCFYANLCALPSDRVRSRGFLFRVTPPLLVHLQIGWGGKGGKFSSTDLKKWEKQLGWRGKTGGLFWGWNVPLQRHGSDQVCPGNNQLPPWNWKLSSASNFDNIAFLKVVLFPSPTKHFGYLVIVSCASVFTGLCFFAIFVWFVLPVIFCINFQINSVLNFLY